MEENLSIVPEPALLERWSGEDVRLADVESQLARLREATAEEGSPPSIRTSVMTHIAWVPEEWADAARATLAGMAEEHPSRTLLLVPLPDSGHDRIDAEASVECYRLPGTERHVCSEVVELQLHGPRAKAPASVVSPLLISDSHTYGTIGVVFTLITWFFLIGGIIVLGAVFGAAWQAHAEHEESASHSTESR